MPADVAPVERPVCSIAGVTLDNEWGLLKSGLYEFKTDRNRLVRLHDSDLTDVLWQPGEPARLTIRFRWNPEWIPPEQVDEPVTVFEFTGVVIDQWTDTSALGVGCTSQVSLFHWNWGVAFSLDAYDVGIDFRALSLRVRTEP